MVYVVKFKATGRTNQTILRICTEESECFKLKSDGSLVPKRNCEYNPDIHCQEDAEKYAYRPVLCNGIKVPRITCRWDGSAWIPRQIGATPNVSASAKSRLVAERCSSAGRADQIKYHEAHRDEHIKYMHDYNRKYRAAHKSN